jgi:type I restriction enzyme R subunit
LTSTHILISVRQKDFDAAKPLTAYDRCAIEEYETDNGPADYALAVNGHIVGVVEAKKLSLGPQNVLVQAERYSKGVKTSSFNWRGFRVPFSVFDQRRSDLAP